MAHRKSRRSKRSSPSLRSAVAVLSLLAILAIVNRHLPALERLVIHAAPRVLVFFAVALGLAGLGWSTGKLAGAWRQARRQRAIRLADIDRMTGHEFEHYVAGLLAHRGFDTRVTQRSGDLGVDIVAHSAQARYAVQCKRQNGNVARTAVSDAVAGKAPYRCTHAMVVTNRYFTPGAAKLARATQCILVDRDQLATWLLELQQHHGRRALPRDAV
ncbi:restriction endonuclease [Pandoraea sp.]|uniref:restriction endonuclease n=1 Tax=Pandoraea sp. TaxID=1883445 RepID=UPI00120B6E5F|nr:restriction endonuclease [Pandoraea sp.]TAL53362.1 MAG: restriction endonuclease [Pandoraea sp.]TAM20452.1 MAG: restriction endonuclease [Pandoraea sp.]